MKKPILIGIFFFAIATLHAADSLDLRLLKISKSLHNASSTNAIKKHFSTYTLSPKELATVYSYYLINNIDYDCNSFISGNIDDISSSDILVQRKAVCYGYSKVFSDLCNSSGIHCYIVKGMSKGFSYSPGKVPVESNHSWNVIKIDSQYHLIDLTWAAGYVAYEGKTLKFIREADPKQIFADPNEFIKRHLPHVPWFQLLSPTVTGTSFYGLSKLPGHNDLSATPVKVNFTQKLDDLDTMDYADRNSVIIDIGEKYFSRPEESASDMTYLSYQLMMRSSKLSDLQRSEQMLLKAQGYLKKLPDYKSKSLWKNMEQNLSYCRNKMAKAR